MKHGVALGMAFGLIVSAVVGAAFVAGGGVGDAWFVVSPGLLSHAAASDMLQRPPWYETWPLFVLVNLVWYALVGLLVAAAAKAFAWFKPPEGL
jgi:hypothetical protein